MHEELSYWTSSIWESKELSSRWRPRSRNRIVKSGSWQS